MHDNKILIENYKKSKKDYNPTSKSFHWESFNKDFDKILDISKLKNFRKNKLLSKGLDDEGKYFDLVSKLIYLIDKVGLKFLEDFKEVKIGSPEVYKVGGIDYNYSDLFIINFFHRIVENLKSDPKNIIEIGGGYGAMAYKLKKKYPNSTIFLIDLPEAGLLQAYYLKELFKKSNFFIFEDFLKHRNDLKEENFKNIDFVILHPQCLKNLKFKNFFDLAINTRSFMEMRSSEIKKYFDYLQIALKDNALFYNVNKYHKSTSGDVVKIKNYPYDNNWFVQSSATSWKQENMHEIIAFRRLISPQETNIAETLSLIKDINIPEVKDKNYKIYFKICLRKLLDLIFKLIPKKILEKILKIYY